MAGPLAGIRVIDLTAMVSGPVATMILGDQGADVIKIEPPRTGDLVREVGSSRAGISALFATTNRNKRSIVVDLKHPGGARVVRHLARRADVFVQNFRPGVAERLGVGEASIREERSDLVYASISGFGESGPYAQQRAYDPVIQALSGMAAIQGERDTGRPRMVRTIVSDKLTGLTAAQAITAALLARERSAAGQHVRIAMLDATLAFLWPEGMARHTLVEDAEPANVGRAQIRELVFETSDGWITAGTVTDREWEGFTRAVGRPEWLDDARFASAAARIENWDTRLELMQSALRSRTSAEWLERLSAEGVPCAPILSRRELLVDPQVAANQLIVETHHPRAGRVRQARPAARFSATPASIRRPAPMLGEHTDEVLREAGFDDAQIAALRESGAVA